MTAVLYKENILAFVCPFINIMSSDSIMDDNVLVFRIILSVITYKHCFGMGFKLCYLEWTSRSTDLNSIEHGWDMLGKRLHSLPDLPSTFTD